MSRLAHACRAGPSCGNDSVGGASAASRSRRKSSLGPGKCFHWLFSICCCVGVAKPSARGRAAMALVNGPYVLLERIVVCHAKLYCRALSRAISVTRHPTLKLTHNAWVIALKDHLPIGPRRYTSPTAVMAEA